MLTEFVEKAMQQAEYEQMENGIGWGEVASLRYTWTIGPTKEACAKELRDMVGRLAVRETAITRDEWERL